MNVFERYLTLWVVLCIVAGVASGQLFPAPIQAIGALEVARVNLPVSVLIWVMIIPMLLRIDFAALGQVKDHARGIGVTLAINWVVKPFSMALLAWIFIKQLFAPWLPADQIDSYVAGLILLAAAPCTAMVFVWSRLTNGDPYFTLTQVALNDPIKIFAFAPIVALLLGVASITVPWGTLFTSVLLYIVVPVIVAQVVRATILRSGGQAAASAFAVVRPRAARHARAAVCVPGKADPYAAADHRLVGGADIDPGVFQRGCRLPCQPGARRETQCRVPFGADRRIKLLRAGSCSRHQPFWSQLRRRTRDRCRRADRGSGDARGRSMG